MGEPSQIKDRLGAYLNDLSPVARDLLLKKLQVSEARGELDETSRLLLSTARRMAATPAHAAAEPAPAPAAAARITGPVSLEALFFAPFEAFAVDEVLHDPLPGRLTRTSFAKIWTFVSRDIAPELVKPWENGRIPPGISTHQQLDTAVDALRKAVAAKLRSQIARLAENPRDLQKHIGQAGGERAFNDMRTLAGLEERRNALATSLRALPEGDVWDAAQEKTVLQVMSRHLDASPKDDIWLAAALAGRPAVLMLPRLAAGLSGSSSAQAIRQGYGRAFLEAAVCELSRLSARFVALYAKGGRPDDAMRALKLYNDLNQALYGAVFVDEDDAVRQQVAVQRRSLADRIKSEIEAVVATVRRALAPGAGAGATVDSRKADGEDAVRVVTLLLHARRYKEALAMNELTTRLLTVVQQTVEAASGRLISDLARASADQRAILMPGVDCAAELSGLLFGDDYAAQVRRRQQAALRGAA